MDGVQGYDEDQIALVILDLSNFPAWVPVVLGSPMISCIINMIKEKEIDALGKCPGGLPPVSLTGYTTIGDPSKYDDIVTSKDTETTDAFSSHVIHRKMRMAHTGEGISVMIQALHAEDGSLSQGLMVQNVYTELCSGSKNIAVVVRNSMAYSLTLRRKTPVVRAAVVTWVPELPVQTSLTGHWKKTKAFKPPS